MISDCDSHILSAIEAGLVAAVASQDIVMLEHIEYNLICCLWRKDFTEEIVRLRWHDTKETDASEFLLEVISLS